MLILNGSTALSAVSRMPPSRSTIAQEKMRTSPFDQNGRMTSRKIASRLRPFSTLAST